MRKTFLEMIEVVATAIVLSSLLGLATGAGAMGTIMTICDNLILVAIVLMVDDLFFRVNRYRDTINLHYLVLMCLETLGVIGFAAAKNALTLIQNYLGLAFFILGSCGALVWYIRVYSYDVCSELEIAERLLKRKLREFCKKKDASPHDLASELERICAHHFIGDRAEAGFDSSRPFDPLECPVSEIKDQVEIELAQKYLLACAKAYTEKIKKNN